MIGEFENIKSSTGISVANENKFAKLKTVFLTLLDFDFDTEDNFLDEDYWFAGIKTGNIIPIINLKEMDDNTEPENYYINAQDSEIKISGGKYKFNFRAKYSLAYHHVLDQLSGQAFRVMFADMNKNIYACNLVGTIHRGFDVELFNVENKKFSSGVVPAWTQIRIVLADADQFDKYGVISQMDFNPNKLTIIFVDITDISSDASTDINFTVTDSEYGLQILGLSASQVQIIDNTGVLTIINFQELGEGNYSATVSDPLTFGSILIDDGTYYGNASYVISSTVAEITNITFASTTQMSLRVTRMIDDVAITGLTIDDFTITDDTHGVLTAGVFTEDGDGYYTFASLSSALTAGDIVLDDEIYDAEADYTLAIALTVDNFDSTYSSDMYVDVSITDGGAPLTGLIKTNFIITDDVNGSIIVNTCIESPAGTYRLLFAEAKTIGSVAISKTNYYGSGDYDFSGCSIENTGGTGATDWLDSDSDGKADRVSTITAYAVCSILTDGSPGGFTGRAQRCAIINPHGVVMPGIQIYASYFETGKTYKLRFLYRAYYSLYLTITMLSDSVIDTLPSNTLNALEYESENFTVTSADYAIIVSLQSDNGYFDIDELELIEV
jgi:hypothetical protein